MALLLPRRAPGGAARAALFGTGDFNPHFFIWPGTLLIELAFLAYVGLFAVGRLAGWWTGAQGFAAAYFRDPTAFYILPRLQSVAFGVWAVGLAHAIGRRGYSTTVGLAAALGLAVNAVHAHYSHFAHPVTAMTAFTLLGLWAALRVAQGGGPRDLYVGAVAVGLGVATQFHAALLAVPLAIAVAWRVVESPGERGRWLCAAARAAALAIGLYLLISPFTVLDFRTFWGDLRWIGRKTEGSLAGGAPVSATGVVGFVTRCLVPGLGLPVALLAAFGTVWALARRTRADWLLLGFAAAYLLLAGRAASINDRYAIPLVAPALLLAARAVEESLARLRLAPRAIAAAVPAAVLLASAPVAFELIETDYTMMRADTRVEALDWFESHVPENERVVIDMAKFWNSHSAPLAENAERLRERLVQAQGGLSGAGHSSAYAEYYRYRLEHPHHPAYYLRSTNMGGAARPLAEYRREGFRWAVVSEEAVAAQERRAAAGDSSGAAYYRALAREAAPVAEFTPEPWKRRGPRILVYRIAP